MNKNPTTTVQACKKIADDLNIDSEIVSKIIDNYHLIIFNCLKAELPFTLKYLGKFYCSYFKVKENKNAMNTNPFWVGRVMKSIKFEINFDARQSLQGWVHDLGMKSNLRRDMAKLVFKPEEIEKIRKKKLLADQKALGFRSDLLFDANTLPAVDKDLLKDLEKLPTVDEVRKRISHDLRK